MQAMTEETTSPDTETPAPGPDAGVRRRGILAGLIAAIVGIVPVIPGIAFFLDPLIRKKKSASGGGSEGEGDFVRVASIDALPDDGTPKLFTVYKDVVDAWNKFPNQAMGSVFLRKMPDGSIACFCFNQTCPHLGCAVNYRGAERDFFCPCHTSAFNLEGEKTNAIPPRGMDVLETKVDDGQILVDYKKFRGATSERIPVS
jgi:menaquinol-cytochrome c reductase iron-sulfur subunit